MSEEEVEVVLNKYPAPRKFVSRDEKELQKKKREAARKQWDAFTEKAASIKAGRLALSERMKLRNKGFVIHKKDGKATFRRSSGLLGVPSPEELLPMLDSIEIASSRKIIDKHGKERSIPKALGHRRKYNGTAESVYTMHDSIDPADLDEAVTKALVPDLDPEDVALSVREARYMGARVVGLSKNEAVGYADGNMSITPQAAQKRSALLERTTTGAIKHVRRHIAELSAELLKEGLSLRDMANLAVSTFAEVASNASGKERTADRLNAASHLAKVAGLYDRKAEEEEKKEESSEDAMKAEIVRKLTRMLEDVNRKEGITVEGTKE